MAAAGAGDVTCRFEFFRSNENRRFAAGWKRTGVEFRNASYERVPGGSAEAPYIAIDVTAPAGQTAAVSMGALTLEGPDCAKWRDAFSAQ
jgi:hypothetical protein